MVTAVKRHIGDISLKKGKKKRKKRDSETHAIVASKGVHHVRPDKGVVIWQTLLQRWNDRPRSNEPCVAGGVTQDLADRSL